MRDARIVTPETITISKSYLAQERVFISDTNLRIRLPPYIERGCL
jgi:hypothetical protein